MNPHKIAIGIGATPTGTGEDTPNPLMPQGFTLEDNFPNPFNPETHIKFTVASETQSASKVRLTVYDVLGHQVRELVNVYLTPGEYVQTWDGRDDNGSQVASGVYLYEIVAQSSKTSETFMQAKKMLLVR